MLNKVVMTKECQLEEYNNETAAETIKMWVDFHKINYVHKDCDLNFY